LRGNGKWARAAQLALVGWWPAALLAGCGVDAAPAPTLELGVAADWLSSVTAADQVGYYFYVLLEQRTVAGVCHPLPPSLQVTANGQEMPMTLDSNGCLNSQLTIGPLLQPPPGVMVVAVEDGGRMVAQAMAGNLTPGVGAALAIPADGRVQAGDEIVILPPPALPSAQPSIASVFPLQQTPWPGVLYATSYPVRLADGIHFTLPSFEGQAAVVMRGTPLIPVPMLTCEGFAVCTAIATNTLGPVLVTESM
jgi:hypothetical protein